MTTNATGGTEIAELEREIVACRSRISSYTLSAREAQLTLADLERRLASAKAEAAQATPRDIGTEMSENMVPTDGFEIRPHTMQAFRVDIGTISLKNADRIRRWIADAINAAHAQGRREVAAEQRAADVDRLHKAHARESGYWGTWLAKQPLVTDGEGMRLIREPAAIANCSLCGIRGHDGFHCADERCPGITVPAADAGKERT